MTVLLGLSFLVLLFWMFSFVQGLRMMAPGRVISDGDDRSVPDPLPRVSVCVPARDEEGNLDACLRSLRAQDYPNLEIVVVNDRSTDRTGSILDGHAREDPRVVAVTGEEPPEGWYGKPNAVRQAAARASGDWFLFTDADTVHAPNSVRNVLGYALAEQVAAVSLTPNLVCRSFWEKLVMPTIGTLVLFRHKPDRVNDPGSPVVFGNGQFFLVNRRAYEQIGGISVARNAIDEDVVFARFLKNSGLGYRFVPGRRVFFTRMYSSLGDIFRGFGKNMYSTIGRNPLQVCGLSVFMWILSLVPIASAVWSALALAADTAVLPSWCLVAGVAQFFVLLVLQTIIRKLHDFTPWMSILAPLSGMIVWLILVYSMARTRSRKGVTWKGRSYRIG